MTAIRALAETVRNHRCFSHPIFEHWAEVDPAPTVVGALFHQIQSFCASTRPGGNLPLALERLGLGRESRLLQEIVESEDSHGPGLATMAGYILNRSAGETVCPDLQDQEGVEEKLKECSDELLGNLPGYERSSGLTVQCRQAISVFARRNATDPRSTRRNLGTTLALEIISNRHLIPGEKHALVDSGIYGVTMQDAEMHYLLEHYGECGAEAQHEQNAMSAVEAALDGGSAELIFEGASDFLDSLAALWDVLDATLLHSGFSADVAASPTWDRPRAVSAT